MWEVDEPEFAGDSLFNVGNMFSVFLLSVLLFLLCLFLLLDVVSSGTLNIRSLSYACVYWDDAYSHLIRYGGYSSICRFQKSFVCMYDSLIMI